MVEVRAGILAVVVIMVFAKFVSSSNFGSSGGQR